MLFQCHTVLETVRISVPSPRACSICGKVVQRSKYCKTEMTICSGECLSVIRTGGNRTSKYSLGFNNALREMIRDRDGHVCVLCNRSEESCHRKLSVHHIDYDKANLDPDNLVSLCRSCHMSSNFDREFWTEWLGQLMSNHPSKERTNVA